VKRNLALDLDDVIYPFLPTMIPFHNDRYGTEFTVDDYHTFDFHEVWGGTRSEAMEKVVGFFDVLHKDGPVPDPMAEAATAIDKLAGEFRLVIVTARFDELRRHTHAWLDKHFPGLFEEVHLCNSFGPGVRRTKASICDELDAVALVDDSLKNVTAVAATGRKAVLFGDYAWNRAGVLPAGVKRALTWDEVVSDILGPS